jgi:hypothetical protein
MQTNVCLAMSAFGTHDAICDVFASIAQEIRFQVVWEQLHVFPFFTL